MPYDPTEVTVADRLGTVLSGMVGMLPFGHKLMGQEPAIIEARKRRDEEQRLKLEEMRLQNETRSFGNELGTLQVQEARETLQSTRKKAALGKVTQYMLEGKNPLDYLPEQMLRDSEVPISVGATLLDAAGDPIHEERKIKTIEDVFGDQIRALPDRYQGQFAGVLKYPAAQDIVDNVGKALQETSRQRALDYRDLTAPTGPKDPTMTVARIKTRMDAIMGQLAQLPPGPQSDEQRVILRKSYNGLIPSLQRALAATGAEQDELDMFQPMSIEQAATPENAVNWFQNIKDLFTPKPKAPPASGDAVATKVETTPPPAAAVTTTSNPAKPAKKVYSPHRSGESAHDYIARLKKTTPKPTDQEILQAVKKEYPALLTTP